MQMLDRALIFFQDWVLFVKDQFVTRTFLTWLLFFFPLVVFFELPRYATPLIVLPLLRLLGLHRDESASKEQFLSTNPSVSVLVPARNEEGVLARTLDSLLSMDYANMEIVVVDDASTDGTYEVAKRYADRGLIKLYRNSAASGRGGRPSASNLGLRVSTGDFIISVDADTTFDRHMLREVIGPFHDPRVGVVAGNLKVRNTDESFWTELQAVEYMISIGLWKRWTDLKGTTLQASGAFGAFRRETLEDVGAWSSELAEDADISLKARKLDWRVAFAPRAIAMTDVPSRFRDLVGQRVRWDRGFLRTYFHKHGDLLRFWRFKAATTWELVMEYLMVVVFNLLYPVYIALMLVYLPRLLVFVLGACYVFYGLLTFSTLLVAVCHSERRRQDAGLLQYAFLYPAYKGIFRWVRTYALVMEILRLKYRDPYLPESAYENSEVW